MAGFGRWLLFLLHLVLAVSGQNPFIHESGGCALKKCKAATKLRETEGNAVRYRYTAGTASTMAGVTTKNTSLSLQCDIIVHTVSECERAITLENLQLHTVAVVEGAEVEHEVRDDQFSSTLLEHPIRYSFYDGLVEDVCSSEGDPTWSINIKKGIISALQNTMERLDLDHEDMERDITGDCPTTYRVQKVSSDGLHIVKVRDLNSCSNRFSHTSHIQGVGYNIKAPVQNLPIINSRSSCHQVVRGNRIVRVSCEERHLLQPFSNNGSGAVTTTSQDLVFSGEESSSYYKGSVEHRSNLLYNHLPAKSAFQSHGKSLGDAEELVEDLCKDDSEVRLDTTSQFSRLINDLRGMSHAQISSLYRLSPKICRHGQKFIEDALPVVSTSASMTLMRDLIVGEEVTTQVANAWLLALNFIPSVDLAMLQLAGDLLTQRRPEVTVRVHLAVGAVLRQYCQQHEQCQTESAIMDIVNKLAKKLGSNCEAASEKQEKLILLSLRALGNAGISTDNLVMTLNECFLLRSNPARIKVAAVEAFRRFSCEVGRNEMRSSFTNINEDSEVRIAAYLGLMRCPSFKGLEQIYESLSREPINQVGSFIWTHLTNLQETASPYQMEVQGVLADLHLQRKFSADVRKFSRNMEISGFNSQLHLGTSLDSNLVYSSRSYIPRSLSSNLTFQMFGESVNLLEVGMRTEGMEKFVESVFAPGGILHGMGPQSADGRSRRQIPDQTKYDQIKEKFDAAGQFGKPMAAFHMKVFGHEIDYLDLRGQDIQQLIAEFGKNGPAQWLARLARTETVDYSRTLNFLEGTYIVPTALGLPLNMTTTAVAAINVQMSGNAKLDQLLSNQKLDLAFHLKPSGAITFDGSMIVDGFAVQLGLDMRATLHSSTLVDASLKMQGYRMVEAKFNMPKDRMDIYNFESTLRFTHQESRTLHQSEISIEDDDHARIEFNSCTGGHLYKGWHTCAHLMYINASSNSQSPYFPLTGPAKMGLYIEKTDKPMQGYLLKWELIDTQFDHIFSVEFDTPLSDVNRAINLKLRRKKANGMLGFRLSVTGDAYAGKGVSWWDSSKKGVQLTVQREGVGVADLTAVLEKTSDVQSTVYQPTFMVVLLGNLYVSLKGTIKRADAGNARKRLVDLSLKSPFINLELTSEATQSRPLYKSKISIKHSLGPASPDRQLLLVLESLQEEDAFGGIVGHWMVVADLDFSDKTKIVRSIRWDSKSSPVGSLFLFQTALRPENFGENSIFSLGYSTNFVSGEESRKVNGSVEFRYPSMGLDLRLAVEHENIYQGLRNKITLRYAPGGEIRSELNVTGLPLLLTGRVEAHWLVYLSQQTSPIALQGLVRLIPRMDPAVTQACQFRFSGTWFDGMTAVTAGEYHLKEDYEEASMEHNTSFSVDVADQRLMEGNAAIILTQSGVKSQLQVDYRSSEYVLNADYYVAAGNYHVERSLQTSVTYPDGVYSVYGSLGLGDRLQCSFGAHLDRFRDIQLEIHGDQNDTWTAGGVDVKWDANRDPTQRLALNFALDRQLGERNTHNLTASFIYPVNTVKFTMERSLSGDWQSLSYTNKLLLDYGDSDPLALDMEVTTDLTAGTKNIAVDAVAKSPFQDWRVNSINMRYKRSPFDLDSRLEVSAAGEEVTFTVGGVTKFPVEVDLVVNLTSTLTRWNDLTGRIRHHLQPGQSSVSAINLMTSNHRIATGLRLEDLSTASERKYQADLNFTSSFQGFHEAGVLVEGLYRPGQLQVTAASRLENQGHDLIVSVNKSANHRIRGLVTVHQRHPNVNKLKLELAVDPTENGRSFKSELLWPNNRAALEGDFHIASPQNFGLGLQFISPFEALKDAGLMLKHKRDGRIFDSEFRVAWILSSPLALKLKGDLKSILQFEMSTELQLPLDKWNRYSLNVKNNLQREEKKLLSSIEVLVDSYKTSIQLDGSLGATAKDKKFSTLTVVLPFGPVSTAAITGSVLNYKQGVYEVYLAPSWQMTDGSLEQIRATGMVEVGHAGNGGQVQGTLRLLTPWYPLLYVEMLHSPTDTFGAISRMEGSLGARRFLIESQLMEISDLDGYRLSVNTSSNLAWVPTMDVEATVAAKPHFSTVLTVWTPKQYRLTFGGDIHSLERKYLTAELQTPLVWLDKSSVRLELTGEEGNYQAIGDVEMPDDGQSITLKGTINPQELHFTLDTPFESFSQAEFRISSGHSPGLYSPVLLLTWNNYKLELTGTAETDGSSWPNKLSGSLVMHLPVGPAVDGTLQIETIQGEELVYKVILSTTGDQQRYDLEAELHAGPLRYGIVYQLDSDEPIMVGSGSLMLEMNAQNTDRTALLVEMATQHPLIRNISLNVHYTLEENGGRIGGWEFRHPMLSIEGSGRILLPSWMLFEISGKFLLTTKHLTLNKAIRLYHSPTEQPDSGELGVGWNLGGRLGKYHCLVKHTIAANQLDFLLLAGPDVWENRTAPTDLNVGVDVDGHASMARAVLNVEVAKLKYTLDVDYSIQLPYRGSLRTVRRGLDSEWEITAAVSLQPESGQLLPSGFYSYEPTAGDRWIGTANFSLPSAEYERILSRFTVLPAYPSVEFSGQAEIQPRSSFYEQSSHSLELKTDFSQLPEMSGSVVYEKTGRNSDDVTRTTGTLITTYNSDEIGALLHGELAGGAYSGHLQKISTDSTGSAMINITTSRTALRQFLAEYTAEGGSYPSQTTFSCFHNERSLIQGVYTRDLLDSGAHYHSIIVQNPLHPFSANATYNVVESERNVEVGVSSLLNTSLTAMLTARLQTTASSRDLDATLKFPEHVVLFNHGIAMLPGSYVRTARIELSPQLFVGYQLHFNTTDEQDLQERAVCLRLDLPPRSLALTASGALTSPSSDISLPGAKSSLIFQWDLLREPEYQVEAGVEFSDLSTADKLHYNITLLGDILGKPLSLVSSLQHSAAEPVLLDATFRYRADAASLMTVSYGVLDQSRGAKRDLTSTLYIAHPISKLSITGKGHLEMNAEIVKLAGTYTYLDLQDDTLEAEISFNMNRKLGNFEGKIKLPSILYEMRWIGGASGYRLTGSETPVDYRSPRTLTVHIEPNRPTFKLEARYDADSNKQLHVSAGVLNSRHWQMHVFRDSGVYHVDDVVLFVRLNHSHLLSSQARWRTEIAQELQTWVVDAARDYRAGLRYAVAKEWRVKTGAMQHDLLQTLAEELQLLSGDFATERDGSILGDYLGMQETVMEAFDDDVFYMQTVWSYIYGNDAAFVNAALNQLSSWIEQMREDLGIINETVYNALNRFIDYVRDLLSSSKSTGQGMTATLEQLAMEIIEAYHQWVRHVYVRVSLQLRQIYATVTGYINHRFMQAIEAYRPQLLMLHHTVETNVVNLAKDVFNWFQGEFTQTELFMSIQWIQKQIDQIYRDIQERDTITNILDYSKKVLKWAYMHFGLDELIGEPWMWLQQKWSHPTPVIAKTKEIVSFVYGKLQWMADQVGLWQKIHMLLLRFYEDGDQLWAQTAITSTQRYFEGKGMMEMRPNEGYISYVQLLPMPWYGLNQTPVWQELPEIQKLKSFQSWMKQSEWSIYDLVYYYWPGTNPYDWLPPFKAQAVISGSSHIVTFDGKLYTIRSDCSYLLAADLLNDRFQIFAQFRSSQDLPKLISISAGGHTIQLGATDVFSIKIDGESAEAPATVGQMSVVRSGDVVSVKLPGLVEVSCNQRADLCSIEISGWLFGRTGGLLGTYDNEQYSDLYSPDHYQVFPALFAGSWSLDRCSNSGVRINELIKGPLQDSDGEQRRDGFCWGLLGDARSEYRICHRLVDPAPYLAACTSSLHQSRCVAIQAYVLACQHRGMPLKVPNKCVRCDIRGQAVIEGKTVVVNNKNPSTEVVFIIEAKECNKNITQPRAIRRLVAALETALIADGFVDVRYAVVAFGGSDSLAEPQALTVKGNVFNRAGKTIEAFDNIQTGDGNEDVFGALRFAALLPFSAGVSRTFILIPCSTCSAEAMSFDYTTLANAFAEQQVTLHVLMHHDFQVEKSQSQVYGIDRDHAWTTRDANQFQGDTALLKHVKPPKESLHLCGPLARKETKGSVFSANVFRPNQVTGRLFLRPLKRFLTVFSRRVAMSARPRPCEECECITAVDGTARPVCYPCSGLLPLDPEDDIFLEGDY